MQGIAAHHHPASQAPVGGLHKAMGSSGYSSIPPPMTARQRWKGSKWLFSIYSLVTFPSTWDYQVEIKDPMNTYTHAMGDRSPLVSPAHGNGLHWSPLLLELALVNSMSHPFESDSRIPNYVHLEKSQWTHLNNVNFAIYFSSRNLALIFIYKFPDHKLDVLQQMSHTPQYIFWKAAMKTVR